MEELMAKSAGKHDLAGKPGWLERHPDHYFDKLTAHYMRWRGGEVMDVEDNSPHIVNAAVDAVLLAACVLREMNAQRTAALN